MEINEESTTGSMTEAVADRYSAASNDREAMLCCPIDYDPQYLKVIPQEVLDRDYGCGDPSRYVKEGETVLDLGSGGGKICFIASQIVGEKGKVIGVDINDDMLELARKNQPIVADKIGYDNVKFFKGNIEELKVSRDRINTFLNENPIKGDSDYQKLEKFISDLKLNDPMISDNTVDVVVSNCVLNLVDTDKKKQLIEEIFRVLKKGGRIAISDIVSDEEIPLSMQQNDELWSGCLSGAFQEQEFVRVLEEAGFYAVTVDKRDSKPWQVVEGIEFRSVTIVAYKGKEGPCLDHNQALIYKGPFLSVTDDDGHTYRRGEYAAVCKKTFEIFQTPVYRDYFYSLEPREAVSEADAKPFDCSGAADIRTAKQLKGAEYSETDYDACGDGGNAGGCC